MPLPRGADQRVEGATGMAEKRETRPRLSGLGIRYIVQMACITLRSLCTLGAASVPVADCSKAHLDSHCKTEMKMVDYIQYWRGLVQREGGSEGVAVGKREEVKEERGETLLYLKDWHFHK